MRRSRPSEPFVKSSPRSIWTAAEVEDPSEKSAALRALCQKVTPDHMEGFEAAVEQSLNVTAVWKVHMEEITGKAKLEH